MDDGHSGSSGQGSLTLEQALTAYRDTYTYLASRNLAPRTQREYLTDLGQLCDFLAGSCTITTVQTVARPHLEAFLAHLDQRHLRGAIRRRKVASIRSFFAFLEEAGLRVGNPAGKLVPPETEHNQPRYLTEREYKRLLEVVRYEARDAAIIELLLQTGLRLSEIARLGLGTLSGLIPTLIDQNP